MSKGALVHGLKCMLQYVEFIVAAATTLIPEVLKFAEQWTSVI